MTRWLTQISILNIIRLMAASGCAALLALSAYVAWGRYTAEVRHRLDVADAALGPQTAAGRSEAWPSPWAQALSEVRGVLLLAALAVVLTLLVTALVTRRIGQGLLHAELAARAIADGDLSSRPQATARNELDRLLQVMGFMASQLTASVGQVRSCADEMAQASEAIAGGSRDLACRSQQAAAQLQDTAKAVGEIQGAAQDTAAAARQASQAVAGAREAARQGGEVMADVARTMGEIHAGSQRMQDIISVIDGIAFRTNILALNAAVEAARAGEQGRGFAVVAGEVRTLAGRCAEAAREIRTLIHTAGSQVASGTQRVQQAGGQMHAIEQSVQEVNLVVARISVAAEQQATGVRHIHQAVSELDALTRHNSGLVKASGEAVATLRVQGQRLLASVNRFRLDGAS